MALSARPWPYTPGSTWCSPGSGSRSLNPEPGFLAMGLVPQVFGYLALNHALGYLPASIVAPIMLGQPVVTAILAGPLLGEALSLWQVLSLQIKEPPGFHQAAPLLMPSPHFPRVIG
ncbi:MAG: DMT family transporter [Chloroflexi bacterium]|nr:DMT family transporter [Chloroflexota bacterium]